LKIIYFLQKQAQIYHTHSREDLNKYNRRMRLLFVADGRSPIAVQWIEYFVERGDEVHLASTFPCKVDLPLKSLEITPVAFSNWKRGNRQTDLTGSRTLKFRIAFRTWLGPLTLPLAIRRLRKMIQRVKPDLIHGMRIPFEGILASKAARGMPLAVSVWGNDFTLHAAASNRMKQLIRKTLTTTVGLHTDCSRDQKLAANLGFDETKPFLVAPGNGGVKTSIFHPPKKPVQKPTVLNPRGIRGYVRNDVFFKAIPLILAQKPETRFVCAAMQRDKLVEGWIEDLNIGSAVELLEPVPHRGMAEIYRRCQVLVSPSVHDGTPNTLLEGMASGCFPVAGDLESIREWIVHGRNGLLMDANDPASIAEGVLTALDRPDLRADAAEINSRIIASRAEFKRTMELAREFYRQVIFHA
jgi:glycosyltransferase involved in cell wall biosynthesis